jgi:hypothetical protein
LEFSSRPKIRITWKYIYGDEYIASCGVVDDCISGKGFETENEDLTAVDKLSSTRLSVSI